MPRLRSSVPKAGGLRAGLIVASLASLTGPAAPDAADARARAAATTLFAPAALGPRMPTSSHLVLGYLEFDWDPAQGLPGFSGWFGSPSNDPGD